MARLANWYRIEYFIHYHTLLITIRSMSTYIGDDNVTSSCAEANQYLIWCIPLTTLSIDTVLGELRDLQHIRNAYRTTGTVT